MSGSPFLPLMRTAEQEQVFLSVDHVVKRVAKIPEEPSRSIGDCPPLPFMINQ
jgi:hypothetical protein